MKIIAFHFAGDFMKVPDIKRFLALCVAVVTPWFAASAHAQSLATAALAKPQGAVILTISGSIARTNSPGIALLDAAMIDALPQRTLVTKTPWHEGTMQFTGPLLSDVLALVGAKGEKIKATALNDFSATIPMADMKDHDVVLAHSIDGKRLAVRDKGPLFIIYPFDQKAQLRSSVYYARSVWQLHQLNVR
jgi:hypothetical protein